MTATPIIDTPDFRAYPSEAVPGPDGRLVIMQRCEELDPESGRWEPFYAVTSGRRGRRA